VPRKVSDAQKQQILSLFMNGEKIKDISKIYKFTVQTITKQLKLLLGEEKFLELKGSDVKKKQQPKIKQEIKQEISVEELEKDKNFPNNNLPDQINSSHFTQETFVEITPMTNVVNLENQKDISSKPLENYKLPNLVFMLIDKNIELEPKKLKEYPEWHFMPDEDLNRNTLEIFSDQKSAKRSCNKNQKIIKVPNPKVFLIASKFLLAKGISRIIFEDSLLSL